MKTSKSPETVEVTPSKKKLKQARLPFKLISDVPSVPTAVPARKRKLSVADAEPATKVGKICKENDVVEDLVLISDDESKGGQNEVKPINPLVNIVHAAQKKRLQKSKISKNKSKKSDKKLTKDLENSMNDTCDDVEMVEVEVQIHTADDDNDDNDLQNNVILEDKETVPLEESIKLLEKDPSEDNVILEDKETVPLEESIKLPEKDPPVEASEYKKHSENSNEIICLDDSNHSTDMKTTETVSGTSTHEAKTTKTADTEQKAIDNNLSQKSVETDKDGVETELVDNPVTPKRSSERNKTKLAEANKLNTSVSNSEMNESVSSDPMTPKRSSRSSSVTNSQGNESMNESTVSTNLTPKQLQKKLEYAKKKEEREKEKQEREKKRQQEKEERAKQRQEKEDQKKREREEKEEVKRKEKEEKEEQKKKEREEKERQRETEKRLKEMKEEMKKKEKEEKEEQRKKEKEAREDERRKKQEALEQEKQEQEQKKKKAAEAFVNFFVPKQKEEKDQASGPVSKSSMLSSFAIKVDMRLAPTVRADLNVEKRETLDKLLEDQKVAENGLYLQCLKAGMSKALSSGKTWPLSDKDDDVMIIEDELPPIDGAGEIVMCDTTTREKLRPKLLSFHENRRPPYWGTWRKKSAVIKPRRPLGQDKTHLYYEVDSDDEWEEEQEGESLDGSVCGSDDEQDARDDYEVDNEVFVPHGYLSDEEATMDEEDMLSLSPETQKARLKHLEDEFTSEMKKPTEKLKPRLYGLLWETSEGTKPEKCVDALWNYFENFAMVLNDPTPLLQPTIETDDVEKNKKSKKKKVVTEGNDQSPKVEKKKKSKTENTGSKTPKTPKADSKKNTPKQPGINSFLTIVKTT